LRGETIDDGLCGQQGLTLANSGAGVHLALWRRWTPQGRSELKMAAKTTGQYLVFRIYTWLAASMVLL
jgi:hypothetical protein